MFRDGGRSDCQAKLLLLYLVGFDTRCEKLIVEIHHNSLFIVILFMILIGHVQYRIISIPPYRKCVQEDAAVN
jgi:hypothetical protein